MITITEVSTSKDLSYSDVKVSSLESEENLIAYLDKIKPILQRKLGKKVTLKKTPKLRFHLDTEREYLSHIHGLIHSAEKEIT